MHAQTAMIAAAMSITAAIPLAAQGPARTPTVSAPTAATIAGARKVLADRYVLPDVAPRLAEALARGEASGRYAGLTGEALAVRINQDLEAVAHDKHLSLSYNPEFAAALSARPPGDDDAVSPAEVRQIERVNGAVRAMEVLPGNIRYLAYDGFIWGTPAAQDALTRAMQFLQGGDAMIIDLRQNGGGSPEAVAAMASYFLTPGTPLAKFSMRGAAGEASVTPKAPFSLVGKPLYVLTSGGTASAAEEFATHVSAFGFGTLVGGTTAGAAYRNDLVPLPGGYVLSVSIGRPVHARTGSDWEAKGVAPTISTTADAALPRARIEAMTVLLARAPQTEKAADERLLAYYRAVAVPITPALPPAAYAGFYGDRKIAFGAEGLTSQRDTRMPVRMVATAPDIFVPVIEPTTQFRFIVEGNRVTGMALDRGNGDVSRFPRTAGPS